MLETKTGRNAVKLRPGLAKDFNPVGLAPVYSAEKSNLWIQQYTTKGRTVAVSTTHSMSRRSDIELPSKIPATAVERANYELMLNPSMPSLLNSLNAVVVAVNPKFVNEEKNSGALRMAYIENPDVSDRFRGFFEENSFFSLNLDRTNFYPEELAAKNRALIGSLYEFTGKHKKIRPSSVDGQILFKAAFVKEFKLSNDGDYLELTVGYDSYDENPEKMALVFSDRDQLDAEETLIELEFDQSTRTEDGTIQFSIPLVELKNYLLRNYWLESSVVDVAFRIFRNEGATITRILNVFTPEELETFKSLSDAGVPAYAINQRVKELVPHEQLFLDDENSKIVITPYSGTGKCFVLQTARVSAESAQLLKEKNVRFPTLASKANRIAKYYAKQRLELPIDKKKCFTNREMDSRL